MNFDLNDEQQEIKRTAHEFLASRFAPEKVRELAEARSYDDALWKQISELGWPGIAVSEDDGGQGLGMVELAVLLEESGYACAPSPLLGTAGAALVISAAGSDEQRAEWLPKLASGEATGAFGGFDHGPNGDAESTLFCDLPTADVAVIFHNGGALLAPASDVEFETFEAIDATRSYGLISEPSGEPLAGDVDAGRDRLAVAIAAELTGIAQRAMEMAVEYARERQQFGRPIGAYQGVGHRCAAMLLAAEESRSLTYFAAWTADAEPESLPMAAAMAGARAADAGWQVPASALQVFGGIGFTWEHDLQFWLKRGRVEGRMLGTPRDHRERVADLSGMGSREPATV
ncbi:MAG TPA: acyl-CoA dehydrogenase family protein [Solirubrobacterales bacterium]|nr:acyl-CoA dehydrogenase family protein [Solirubrobacterales bacterium]